MLPDAELLSRLRHLAEHERIATAVLIAHLAILDGRRLYVPLGYPSLFNYCMRELHFSESAAFHRIKCVRAVRRFPVILDMLAQGVIHMSAVRLVAPHLTADNHRELLDQACHKSQREVEKLVAELDPLPSVPSTVRRLPARGPLELFSESSKADGAPPEGDGAELSNRAHTEAPRPDTGPAQPPQFLSAGSGHPDPGVLTSTISRTPTRATPLSRVKPLGPNRYKVTFTMVEETHEKLREAQALLGHRIPGGDIGLVIDRALTDLVIRLRRRKWGARRSDVVRETAPAYSRCGTHPARVQSRPAVQPVIHS